MAKKKRRKSSKTAGRKTKSAGKSKSGKKKPARKAFRATKRKLKIITRNLIMFALLTLVSFVLYNLSSSVFARNLFSILMIVFGFIGLAFLIVLLIFLILKMMRK